jgi:hypothetical protein
MLLAEIQANPRNLDNGDTGSADPRPKENIGSDGGGHSRDIGVDLK